jgi:hypothetical protein
LALRGLRAVAGLAAPLEALERLDALARAAAPEAAGAVRLTVGILCALGWDATQGERILRGLGFTPTRKVGGDEPRLWRRRQRVDAPPAGPAASPFAALAPLAARDRRTRRRARKRRTAAASMSAQ